MAVRLAGVDYDGKVFYRTFAQGLPSSNELTMTWWYYQDSNRATYNSYMALGPTTFTGADYYFAGHYNDVNFSFEIASDGGDWLGPASIQGRWLRQGFRRALVPGTATWQMDFWYDLPNGGVITRVSSDDIVLGANHRLMFGAPPHALDTASSESINGRMAGIKIWQRPLPADAVKREAMSDLPVLPQYAASIWAVVPVRVAGDYRDYSGKGRHFTPHSTITSIAGPGEAVKGRMIMPLWLLAAAAGEAPVSRSVPMNLEAQISTPSPHSLLLESMISVAPSRNVNLETQIGVTQTRAGSTEALFGVLRPATQVLEALSLSAAARAVPLEVLLSLSRARDLYIESQIGVAQSRVSPVESLQSTASGRGINLESLGQILLVVTAAIPFEALIDCRTSRVLNLESLSPSYRTVTLTLESLLGVARSSQGAIEVLAQTRAQSGANLEGLASLTGVALLPHEALRAIAASAGVPLEVLLGAGIVVVVNVVDGLAYFQISLSADAHFAPRPPGC